MGGEREFILGTGTIFPFRVNRVGGVQRMDKKIAVSSLLPATGYHPNTPDIGPFTTLTYGTVQL